MSGAEIKEFKKYVAQCLVKQYGMSEIQAFKAVRNSYLSIALKKDPDYVIHDTVEEWADYVYNEKNREELLEM